MRLSIFMLIIASLLLSGCVEESLTVKHYFVNGSSVYDLYVDESGDTMTGDLTLPNARVTGDINLINAHQTYIDAYNDGTNKSSTVDIYVRGTEFSFLSGGDFSVTNGGISFGGFINPAQSCLNFGGQGFCGYDFGKTGFWGGYSGNTADVIFDGFGDGSGNEIGVHVLGFVNATSNVFVGENLTYIPSPIVNLSNSSTLKVTNTIMEVQGAGEAVTLTSNPQISPGSDGQIIYIYGEHENNSVTFSNGNGLHLHRDQYTLSRHDMLSLFYDARDSHWEEIGNNFETNEKSWAFSSPGGGSGVVYAGGFYEHSSSSNDFSPLVSFGNANWAHASHAFVVLGAVTVDELTIQINGTSITDQGVRVSNDYQNIVIPNGTPINSYYETSKKWIGAVSYEVISGTPKISDYGFSKYWDNSNSNFKILGLDVTWLGGANDANANIKLIHHHGTDGNTEWTYTGSGATPSHVFVDMRTDYVNETYVVNGKNGAWKRTNLDHTVAGSNSEGIVIEIDTSANKAFEEGTFILSIRPD